jgi:hypothetical protein
VTVAAGLGVGLAVGTGVATGVGTGVGAMVGGADDDAKVGRGPSVATDVGAAGPEPQAASDSVRPRATSNEARFWRPSTTACPVPFA